MRGWPQSQAQEKHSAKSVEAGKYDLVLDPTNLWLTIHESAGHPSELDRVLGYEANFAGTSFLTLDKWKSGKFNYGSNLVNIVADKIQPGSLGAVGWDDEGVGAKEWDIIKDGVLVNYQAIRDQAGIIGLKESQGCCYSQSWRDVQFQRMANISLRPGKTPLVPAELIKNVEKGIYIIGDGSYSIDQQRYNFQFSGQLFYEIRNGQVTGMLKDVAYQANTQEFWNSCSAICDDRDYRLGGEPSLTARDNRNSPMLSHTARQRQGSTVSMSLTQQEKSDMALLTADEAQALLKKVLGFSTADECEVTLTGGDGGNLRYARNSVSTSGASHSMQLVVSSVFGRKQGITTINEYDDASLQKVVQRAEELARLAPDNPEYMPMLPPQTYGPAAKTFIPATEAISSKLRADLTAQSLQIAKEAGLTAAGYIENGASFSARMNSHGLWTYHTETAVDFSVTLRTSDGSGSGYASKGYNVIFLCWTWPAQQRRPPGKHPIPAQPGPSNQASIW